MTESIGSTVPNGFELVQALAELSSLMLATEDLETFLTRIAVLAATSIGVELSCGVTLQQDGRAFTVATSGDRAKQLDELQYAGGGGRCLQAMATGEVVSVPDMTVESRWGDYPAHLLASGVRSTLSMPLIADGHRVGALNLCRRGRGVYGRDERAAALFAASAYGTIAAGLRLAHQVALTEQLRTALSSRAVIDQAIGILIRDRRCGPDEAFDVLRAASQRRNVKLRVVAEEMVTAMSRQPRPGQAH